MTVGNATAALIDQGDRTGRDSDQYGPHPNSRRELVAKLTAHGREVVRRVTAHRRDEIARIVEKMPPPERRGLVRGLTGFTTAGGEPAAHLQAYL